MLAVSATRSTRSSDKSRAMANTHTPTKITNAVNSLQLSEDEDGDEGASVMALPSLAMHGVLSNLGAVDLASAASACPQWEALARSRPLWRDQRLACGDVASLVQVVRAAPPWDSLTVAVDGPTGRPRPRSRCIRAHLKEDARLLVVCVPSLEVAVAVLASDLGPQAVHLRVREHPDGVDEESDAGRADSAKHLGAQLWAGLRGARRLKSLHLRVRATGPLAASHFQWPQNAESRLPDLRKVQLEMAGEKPTAGVVPRPSAALESLLRAHRTQLECVRLLAPSLAPLLDACPVAVRRLAAAAVPGVTAKLQRFSSLEELRFEGLQSAAALELARLLRAPGHLAGLRSLVLRSAAPCKDAVDALAEGQLPLLKHLQLAVPAASMETVGLALAGLRQLHSLNLRPAPAAEALDRISAADIPALRILVVLGPCLAAGPECRRRQVALRRLVPRAPQPLHVLCAECRCGRPGPGPGPSPSAPPAQTLLLAGHPFSPCTASCVECVEARVVHESAFPFGRTATPLRFVRVKA